MSGVREGAKGARQSEDGRYHLVSQTLTSKVLPKEILATAAEESPDKFITLGDTLFY